jgi:uncharacterized coiled-coil DUF342 family protein
MLLVGSKLADNVDDDISRVKNSIAQLYSVMNIEQHQIEHERKLIERIDQLRAQLEPFEKVSDDCHLPLDVKSLDSITKFVAM